MKLITRQADYAIRVVCYAADTGGGIIAVPELVKELKIPKPFLRKILQRLTGAGIFRSYKGLGGGFELLKKSDAISVVKLIEIFQGPLRLNECLFKKMACPNRSGCALRKRIEKIEGYVAGELGSITIGELIKDGKAENNKHR